MVTTGELLALGVQHHERGALREAEQLYRQVLQAEPQNPEALFYLGVIDLHVGRPQLAVEKLGQAIQLRPGVAAFHCFLGQAHWAAGRRLDALAAYEQALRFNPDYADAHNNMGVALQRLGRTAEATVCFEKAVRGNPNFAEACSNLGAAYQDQGRMAEAIASFHHAVRCKPDFAGAYNNLGVAYLAEDRAEEAVAFSRQAVRLQPDYAEAHYNLGLALKRLDRLEEALVSFREAIRYRPDYADAFNDQGLTLHAQGKLPEALASFQEALRLRPDFPDAHLAKASTLLLSGAFEEGWREYEWRWRCPGFVAPPLHAPRPPWDGSPLGGRTILLRAEQGFGDTLQFVRYAPLVQKRGGKIILEAQPPLLSLVRTCPGIESVIALGDVPPPFEFHAYLLSVPRLLGTTLNTVPADVPYLSADPALVAKWGEEVNAASGFKVGIVWQGSLGNKRDRMRSVSLTEFAPLAELAGVGLFSLQVGPGREQLAALDGRFAVTDLGGRFNPASFADAAAVVTNLDLVITVDTALAHLAGALGVPVWVAQSFSPDWRWLLERDDSPWYPSMRLFRQARPGAWGEVFLSIRDALRTVVGSGKREAAWFKLGSPPSGGRQPPESEKPQGADAPRSELHFSSPDPEKPQEDSAAPHCPLPTPHSASIDPHNMMGAALLAQGKLDAAIACWEQALSANPRSADAHNNLGVCFSRLGNFEEALVHVEHALRLKAHFPEAYCNKGLSLRAQGKLEDALTSFDEAVRQRPDFAEAHLARAHTLLLAGDFARGWQAYAWRRHAPDFGAPFYACPQPAWDGSSLEGRTILLRAEQGLGDTIQFIRYAPLVRQHGGRVVVEAQAPLLPLLGTCPGIDQLIAQGEFLPSFDVYALLLGLPGLLGTSLANVPADVPYLAADPDLEAHWRRELSAIWGLKVGIVWQGRTENQMDRQRSVPLMEFAPLAEMAGVHLFSLQVGPGREHLPALDGIFPVTDLGGRFNPASFADAAAAIKNLDVVITVDTALAHLAGALAVPVWVALPFSPDWRWLLGREDSPWYPSMRLFRQPEPGQWRAVFERIAEEMRELVASRGRAIRHGDGSGA